MNRVKKYTNREMRYMSKKDQPRQVFLPDIESFILLGNNFKFENATGNKRTDNQEFAFVLLQTIKMIELRPPVVNDVQLLNKVIRGGGFINYIKRLENGKQDNNSEK